MEMRKLGFEKDKHLATKLIRVINKFLVSMVELKTKQKKLNGHRSSGNAYNEQKELPNVCLVLEHNKNIALMELQRQRVT